MSKSSSSDTKAPILIAPGTNPEPPAGMVAVPVAALSGRQQNQMQQAGQQIGVVGGLVADGGGSVVAGAVVGGYVGQQLGRIQRQAAMHDPAAPMVFVDENSRAGRRAVRRRARRYGPDGERDRLGWLKGLFGKKE
ncbi:hypothetical protein SEUCBS139899_007888 [Sporothrix eucalyptigena]|uniref:Glycine zipper 2TM domain-containing protein n=1 Tax=Sporothrix eucalyptigena TaxID=1812306 RepID=A0ABP0C734_9PEZI